jgi:hypothetical protein
MRPTWLFLGWLAVLPLHRPALLAAWGCPGGLPEILFPAAVLALLWSLDRPFRPLIHQAWLWLHGALLLAGLLPSVLLAPGDARGRAALQLGVLLYIAALHSGARVLVLLGGRDAGLRALVTGAAVACVLGLAGWALALAGKDPLGLAAYYPWMTEGGPRPLGPTESPAMLGTIALGGATATLVLGRRAGRMPSFILPLLGLFGLTLLLTRSRLVLAALLGLGVLGLAGRRPILRALAGMAVLMALAGTAASLTWRVVPLTTRWPFIDLHPSPYRVCHEIALKTFLEHPLAGVGLENFASAWPRHYDPARHDPAFAGMGAATPLGADPSWRELPLDPHGTPQGYLAEAGWPAGLMLLGLGLLLWRARATELPESTAYLAALALAALSLDLLTERSTWALLGLLGRGPDSERPGLR